MRLDGGLKAEGTRERRGEAASGGSVEKQRRGGGLRKGVDLTRGAGLAVRERSGEEELTSGPRVAVRERERERKEREVGRRRVRWAGRGGGPRGESRPVG
jgi:hypothetical protein